jgi:hypothetical protein
MVNEKLQAKAHFLQICSRKNYFPAIRLISRQPSKALAIRLNFPAAFQSLGYPLNFPAAFQSLGYPLNFPAAFQSLGYPLKFPGNYPKTRLFPKSLAVGDLNTYN